MSTEVRTYNPARVVVVVGGIPMQGFANGTFVGITALADMVTSQAGADGEVARAIGTDRRRRVTVTLQQTSPSNDALSGFAQVDKMTCGGATVPILVQDLCGRTMFAAQGWIAQRPSVEFGQELNNRAWVLDTGEPTIDIVGGNG